MSMGSEDVEVQCQTQSVSASVPCESAASYGIATVPFVASVSVAPNRSGTGTPVSAGTVMLAQSGASHTPPQNVAVQPSVAASPLPQVQVIQQPLQNQYVQHLYTPHQQHMFLPGNLTLQPAIQGIAGAPTGISLQLQGKAIENKSTPTLISATPMQSVGNFGAQNIIPAGTQLAPAAKACVQGQMLAASSKSTAVIQGQSSFIPATTANQTVVISQLGVLSNPQSVMPHQAKAITDGQKGKSYLISQPATLHPKSPILPQPSVSCTGPVIATSQLKQLPSAPHIITTQAPTVIASQVVGSLHALGASLPPGITWATPGSLHSPALFSQNPIYIRSQQSDMFIQSPPPQATIHAVPVAPAPIQQQPQPPPPQQQTQQQQQQQQVQQHQQAQLQQPQQIQPQQTQIISQQQQQAHQQQQQQTHQQQQQQQQQAQQQIQPAAPQQIQPAAPQQIQPAAPQQIQPAAPQQIQLAAPQQPPPSSTPAPQVYKPKTPTRPGSSVATQTVVSTSSGSGSNTSASKSQSKQKSRVVHGRLLPAPSTNSVQLQTATTQTQTHPPPSLKADAANQTKPTNETKLAATYNKIIEPFNKSEATETAFSPVVVEPVEVDAPQNVEANEPVSTPDVAVVAPSPAVALVDESIQMEVAEEQVPTLPSSPPAAIPAEKVVTNRKEVEAENIGIVAPLPETTIKDKQPQKAIVKPHVLTHVIEGFVIQEGSEPFPVSLPSYSITSKDDLVEKSSDPYNDSLQKSDILPAPKKKEKLLKIRGGPVELAKCECCGKLKPKAKFKRSKRFCSTSCAKRFNAGNSKRLAIIIPEHQPKIGEEFKKHKKKGSSKKGKSKKKKLGIKTKKSWKRVEPKIYEENEWSIVNTQEVSEENVQENVSPPIEDPQSMEMETEVIDSSPAEESRPPTPPPVEEVEESHTEEQNHPESNAEFATKSPLKWTVTDVVDFVRDLPGCSDYADEFRAQEIDGQALLLLKEDHLMSLMSMKLGPALKVCAKINTMRDEVNH